MEGKGKDTGAAMLRLGLTFAGSYQQSKWARDSDPSWLSDTRVSHSRQSDRKNHNWPLAWNTPGTGAGQAGTPVRQRISFHDGNTEYSGMLVVYCSMRAQETENSRPHPFILKSRLQ